MASSIRKRAPNKGSDPRVQSNIKRLGKSKKKNLSRRSVRKLCDEIDSSVDLIKFQSRLSPAAIRKDSMKRRPLVFARSQSNQSTPLFDSKMGDNPDGGTVQDASFNDISRSMSEKLQIS